MRNSRNLLVGSLNVLTLCAALAASARAEDRMMHTPPGARPGELAIFSAANFNGRSHYVTGERANIVLPFIPRSVMTAPGERWRVCSQINFRGPCVTASGEYGTMARLGVWSLRSAQPAGASGGGGVGLGDPGPSLRGMASEFFPAPRDRGRRALACPGGVASANCAAESADRWCRARGYTGSGHELLETVGRDVVLADVLCQRRAG